MVGGLPLGELSVVIGAGGCAECGDGKDLDQCVLCGVPLCWWHADAPAADKRNVEDPHRCGKSGACRACGTELDTDVMAWCQPCLAYGTQWVWMSLEVLPKLAEGRPSALVGRVGRRIGGMARALSRAAAVLEESGEEELALELMGRPPEASVDLEGIYLRGLSGAVAERIVADCDLFVADYPDTHDRAAWLKVRARIGERRRGA